MQNSKTDFQTNVSACPGAVPCSYLNATGKIRYTMTNDYMFNIIFRNVDILAELLCSLLDLDKKQISSIEIKNPLLSGDTALEKTFILDINIFLNSNAFINIEMQVNNLGDWFDRSLSYLCRSFDQLYHGENYASTKSVLHIGILDFNIFPAHPEFYSSYKLMNVKNKQIYNDKFELRVLQLNHADLATEKDKNCGLTHWASLFKAVTWEEIKMLAHENSVFDKVAQELYKSNSDEQIRYACQAREEYEFQMKRRQAMLEEAEKKQQEYEFQMKRRQEQLEEYEFQMKRRQTMLEEAEKKQQEYESQIKEIQKQLEDKDLLTATLTNELHKLRQELEQLKKDH